MFRNRNGEDDSYTAAPSETGRNGTGDVATLLLCDNAVARAGLTHILSCTNFTVVDSLEAAPALCLIDASNASERVLEAVRTIKGQHPTIKIALIGSDVDREFVVSAFRAGVDGFCLAASAREVLVKSLELVMLGEKTLPGALVHSLIGQAPVAPEEAWVKPVAMQHLPDPKVHKLSPREKDILQAIMGGDPNKVIARKLDVAEATIKVHVKSILRKVGAANRTQAAMWAAGNLAEMQTSAAVVSEGNRPN